MSKFAEFTLFVFSTTIIIIIIIIVINNNTSQEFGPPSGFIKSGVV